MSDQSRKPGTSVSSGYRATRRASKSAKVARTAQRQEKVLGALDRTGRTARNLGWLAAWVLGGVVALAVVLLVLASGVNYVARWSALRNANAQTEAKLAALKSRENLLVIGSDDTSKAVGFLALRVNVKGGQIFGLAIPDGAFLEVPGQGFERAAESYTQGADVSMSAISNFLGVPFQRYIVVPVKEYQQAVQDQSVDGLLSAATKSNLSDDEEQVYRRGVEKVDKENVAIMPLAVKPINLGTQTYFEPQLDEVADVIKTWWGVDPSQAQQTTRVIVYNGAGVPGIAGTAAQALIRSGFRVVDTRNADNFNYQESVIIVQRGPDSAGERARKVLRTGKVIRKVAEQDIADVIVIVGKDYKGR